MPLERFGGGCVMALSEVRQGPREVRRFKNVLTRTGPVKASVPKDCDAPFSGSWFKGQRRQTGVDDLVISRSPKLPYLPVNSVAGTARLPHLVLRRAA